MENISVHENSGARARLKPSALLMWRVALLSLLGVVVATIFKINVFVALTMTSLGVAIGAAGCGFLFQNRKGFTARDNIMANLVGGSCLLSATAILVWTWLL